jgi:hypothetical protein
MMVSSVKIAASREKAPDDAGASQVMLAINQYRATIGPPNL